MKSDKINNLTCPKCGSNVRIPTSWVIGLERVFYCSECKQYFKLDYRLGAAAMALGILGATVVFQLIGYIGAGFATVLCTIFVIPLALFFSLFLRRTILMISTRIRIKRQE